MFEKFEFCDRHGLRNNVVRRTDVPWNVVRRSNLRDAVCGTIALRHAEHVG